MDEHLRVIPAITRNLCATAPYKVIKLQESLRNHSADRKGWPRKQASGWARWSWWSFSNWSDPMIATLFSSTELYWVRNHPCWLMAPITGWMWCWWELTADRHTAKHVSAHQLGEHGIDRGCLLWDLPAWFPSHQATLISCISKSSVLRKIHKSSYFNDKWNRKRAWDFCLSSLCQQEGEMGADKSKEARSRGAIHEAHAPKHQNLPQLPDAVLSVWASLPNQSSAPLLLWVWKLQLQSHQIRAFQGLGEEVAKKNQEASCQPSN